MGPGPSDMLVRTREYSFVPSRLRVHRFGSPDDVGKRWTPWSEGLPAAEQGRVWTMAFSDSFAFVGGKVGQSVGCWRRALPASITAIDVQSRVDIPSESVLRQQLSQPLQPEHDHQV